MIMTIQLQGDKRNTKDQAKIVDNEILFNRLRSNCRIEFIEWKTKIIIIGKVKIGILVRRKRERGYLEKKLYNIKIIFPGISQKKMFILVSPRSSIYIQNLYYIG